MQKNGETAAVAGFFPRSLRAVSKTNNRVCEKKAL